MVLSPSEVTALQSEITNDPESLGYAGKTGAEILAIINAPGSASEANRVPITSDVPVVRTGRNSWGWWLKSTGWRSARTAPD